MSVPVEKTRARRVSVIIPTNNRPAMLRETLASIRALEGPDLSLEILIGDNGNAPETPIVAKEFGAIYLKTDKLGAGPARNLGLRAATGDYFAFSDDDDAWLPGNIRPHLAMLEAQPGLEAVIGQAVYADQNLKPYSAPVPPIGPAQGDDMLRAMLSTWFPQVGTTVARMGVRDRGGMFVDVDLAGEDTEWFIRLAQHRKVAFVATPCILFRGRPFGSYDQINRDRCKAGRRIFLKYALEERRIWRSFGEFQRAYEARLAYFYTYFIEGAKEHAKAGRYGAAVVGVLDAAYVFPFRVILRAIVPKPVRAMFKSAFRPGRAAA